MSNWQMVGKLVFGIMSKSLMALLFVVPCSEVRHSRSHKLNRALAGLVFALKLI